MTKSKNKTKVVSFRLSEDDFSEYEKILASSDMKKSEFFREVFLNANVNITVKEKPAKDYHALLFKYNKASNNLNQLAHRVNSAFVSGGISEHVFKKTLNELINIRELLLSGVNDAD